jgi:hypothetical protein
MKALCLTVILANIFLLLWEYRSGGVTENKASQEQRAIYGKEEIFLLNELKKLPQVPVASAKLMREPQPAIINPSHDINDTAPLKTGEQKESSQIMP